MTTTFPTGPASSERPERPGRTGASTLDLQPQVIGPGRQSRAWARGSTPLMQVLVLSARSLRSLRDPRTIVVGLLQPVIMLLLFSQVFQNVVSVGAGFSGRESYLDYLMPAVLVTTATGSALTSGGWLVVERTSGVFTRLRAMPIALSSILVARSLSDLVRTGVQLFTMIVLSMLLLDYRPEGGPLGLLAVWTLSMVAGCGFSWLFLAVGCWVHNVEIMQVIGFIVGFPLTFASSAYVPLDTLPHALQVIAHLNPITYAVDGARSVTSSSPDALEVVRAISIGFLFTGAGIAAAVNGFRRSL